MFLKKKLKYERPLIFTMLELFHKKEEHLTKRDLVKRDEEEKQKEKEIEKELKTLLSKIKKEKIPKEKANVKQYIIEELNNLFFVIKRLHQEIEKIDKGEICLIEHDNESDVVESINYYLTKLNKDISYAEYKIEELKQKHLELKKSKKAGKNISKIAVLFEDLETKLETIKNYNKIIPH